MLTKQTAVLKEEAAKVTLKSTDIASPFSYKWASARPYVSEECQRGEKVKRYIIQVRGEKAKNRIMRDKDMGS